MAHVVVWHTHTGVIAASSLQVDQQLLIGLQLAQGRDVGQYAGATTMAMTIMTVSRCY